MHEKPCVCPPRVKALSLPSSRVSALKPHEPSKPEGAPPDASPPAGKREWDSELSLLWENLYDIVIFQFVGHPPSGERI